MIQQQARILVVDDIPSNVQILCNALQRDYDVQFAISGEMALSLIKQRPPDLILLDLVMPGMSGQQLLIKLRGDRQTHDIPVIFVTAEGSHESEVDSLNLGISDYITKPITVAVVLARIKNVLERYRLQRSLELSLISADQGLWEWRFPGGEVTFNNQWVSPLGYAPGEWTENETRWEDIVHPQDLPLLNTACDNYFKSKTHTFTAEVRLRNKNGTYRWMLVQGKAIEHEEHEESLLMMGTFMNIHRRKLAEEALRAQEKRMATLIASFQDTVLMLDTEGGIKLCHAPEGSPLSRLCPSVVGQRYADVFSGELKDLLDNAFAATLQYNRGNETDIEEATGPPHTFSCDVTLETKGKEKIFLVSVNPLAGSQYLPTGYLVVLRDITERKTYEEKVKKLAFYDPLTELPNRRLMNDRLLHAQANSAREQVFGALIFIDLDNFKTINDTLGHEKGDELLIEAAHRLQSCLRETDLVARLGGDEFVVILEKLGRHVKEAASQARRIGESISQALCQPYELANQLNYCTPSLGVCLFYGHEESCEQLLKHADLAMFKAKAAGRNAMCFFDPAMQKTIAEQTKREEKLRNALERREFVLHYQPKVDLQGNINSVEALVRWQCSANHFISPPDFIPLAEETGLIIPLGHWILQTACDQLASWQQTPQTAHLTVAVNVSTRQLLQPDFVEQINNILLVTGADPSHLILEFTEDICTKERELIVPKMQSLHSLGITFSLDNFGTGNASLPQLQQLPLEQLKIDCSYLLDMFEHPNKTSVVRALIQLGKSLGFLVTAEGVETEEQLEILRQENCDELQGLLYGPAMSPEEITALIKATV